MLPCSKSTQNICLAQINYTPAGAYPLCLPAAVILSGAKRNRNFALAKSPKAESKRLYAQNDTRGVSQKIPKINHLL